MVAMKTRGGSGDIEIVREIEIDIQGSRLEVAAFLAFRYGGLPVHECLTESIRSQFANIIHPKENVRLYHFDLLRVVSNVLPQISVTITHPSAHTSHLLE